MNKALSFGRLASNRNSFHEKLSLRLWAVQDKILLRTNFLETAINTIGSVGSIAFSVYLVPDRRKPSNSPRLVF